MHGLGQVLNGHHDHCAVKAVISIGQHGILVQILHTPLSEPGIRSQLLSVHSQSGHTGQSQLFRQVGNPRGHEI